MQQNWLMILLIQTLTDSSSLSSQRLTVMNRIISSQGSILIQQKLSQHTSFFGIKLWILIIASASVAFLVVLIFFTFLCFIFHRRSCKQEPFRLRSKLCLPLSHSPLNYRRQNPYNRCGDDVESQRISHVDRCSSYHLPYYYTQSFTSTGGFGSFTVFTFMEIQNMTDGLADKNLIAKGDSSMVYRGHLMGGTVTVAVKRFYPIYQRVLVYEYAEKGDLQEWLHGSAGRNQPLTW